MWVLDRPEHREPNLTVLWLCRWGDDKWPVRPRGGGVNYSAEACGHCVKVWNLVVLLLKRVGQPVRVP
jgi:hypothetical protein